MSTNFYQAASIYADLNCVLNKNADPFPLWPQSFSSSCSVEKSIFAIDHNLCVLWIRLCKFKNQMLQIRELKAEISWRRGRGAK